MKAAELDISLPEDSGTPVLEEAYTIILPDVYFPGPGNFTAEILLVGKSGKDGGETLDAVEVAFQVGLCVNPTGHHLKTEDVMITDLGEDLPRLLSPEVQTVLKAAAKEALRLGHTYLGMSHMIVALRRRLGRRSNVPSVSLLREALEQLEGLYVLQASINVVSITPGLASFLRTVPGQFHGTLDVPDLLNAVFRDAANHPVIREARLLATRPPH